MKVIGPFKSVRVKFDYVFSPIVVQVPFSSASVMIECYCHLKVIVWRLKIGFYFISIMSKSALN